MRRTKRLLYTPGLISLIGLFIALPSFYKENSPVTQGYLPLYMPCDCRGDDDLSLRFSTCALENDIKKRKQIWFSLKESAEENKKRIEVIRLEALKLKYTEDTTSVIVINLDENITYGDYVSLVDICEVDGYKRYASWDNKFAIFGEWPKRKISPSDTIPLLYCGYIQIKTPNKKPGVFSSLLNTVKNNYTSQGLYLLVGYLVLTLSYFVSRRLRKINIEEILN